MRFLVAPDSFKGSLDALAVAQALARGLRAHDVALMPLADGGEGSVSAALQAGFSRVPVRVAGAVGDSVDCAIAFDGRTAVVELAQACGLPTLGGTLAPMTSSTRGLGEAIRYAVALRPTRIVVALGGSASTDGGTGMLATLGATFFDARGDRLEPSGATLGMIARVDVSGVIDLSGIELVVATDVTNPLAGANGAAVIFGPQKGATEAMVAELDAGLARLAGILNADAAALEPGAGAAGGTGFACLVLGGTLVSGAGYFLDLLGFDQHAADSDLVITGEGRLDDQSASGKLVSVVAARSDSTRVIAVVGRNDLDPDEVRALGLDRVYSIRDATDEDTRRDPQLTARILEQLGAAIARDYVV